MDKKQLSEEDIKNRFITPAINKAGWHNEEFLMEFKIKAKITDGKINIQGNKASREKPKYADYVLYYENNYPIAVVEAKDNNHTPIYGLQQAMDYAVKLDIPFAYSSNGDSFVEHDFLTGAETEINLDNFPSKESLVKRLVDHQTVFPNSKYFFPFSNITKQPYYTDQNTFTPRYYQRIAVNRTLNAIENNQKRILLVMATGTGKTYTAFQIIYRLLKSNKKRKILYLADRNILVDQSIEQDFKPLDKIIHKVNFSKDTKESIGAYEVYFSLYQQLAERDENNPGDNETSINDYKLSIPYDESLDEPEDTATRLEQLFTKDFFDLIIVDECHRGSAREASNWRKILEYFDSATQIGMTATPKETDDVSNISYFGEPVYTYSLKEGIEDGFLAPFRVIEETTNITNGWRPHKGQLDENGNEIPDRIYTNSDFDTTIVLRDRTREVAQKITDFLKTTDRMQKTIVFCPTEAAADRMRMELINQNKDIIQEHPDYIARITGGDQFGKKKLDYFISVTEKYPVIATTSKLLSTGVDCKMTKLIVLDEVIGSMTEFKQIIGRGTRIREDDGKMYFTVMDFRGNTKQFADPAWDGPVQVSPGFKPSEKPSKPEEGGEGPIVKTDIPIVDSHGCPVQIIGEVVKIYDFKTGKLLKTENISNYIRHTILEMYPKKEEFQKHYFSHGARNIFEKDLEERGIDLIKYKIDTDDEEIDDYDLINQLAYDTPAKSRHERVVQAKFSDFYKNLPEFQAIIINLLLEQYIEYGISELENPSTLKLDKFTKYGSPSRIAEQFGGTDAYNQTIKQLITELYK